MSNFIKVLLILLNFDLTNECISKRFFFIFYSYYENIDNLRVPWRWISTEYSWYFEKQEKTIFWHEFFLEKRQDVLKEISHGIDMNDQLYVILYSNRLKNSIKLSAHKAFYWSISYSGSDNHLTAGYWAQKFGKIVILKIYCTFRINS